MTSSFETPHDRPRLRPLPGRGTGLEGVKALTVKEILPMFAEQGGLSRGLGPLDAVSQATGQIEKHVYSSPVIGGKALAAAVRK